MEGFSVNSKLANLCRHSAGILTLAAMMTCCLQGCGGGDSGDSEPRYDASGSVSFEGTPVPSGVVTFQHEESKRVAICPISDGNYANESGAGPLAGKNLVTIAGYDGPDGQPLWGGSWATTVNVTEDGVTEDFTISKDEVRPPNKALTSDDPGDQ